MAYKKLKRKIIIFSRLFLNVLVESYRLNHDFKKVLTKDNFLSV